MSVAERISSAHLPRREFLRDLIPLSIIGASLFGLGGAGASFVRNMYFNASRNNAAYLDRKIEEVYH